MDSRSRILRMLAAHQPADAAEERAIQLMTRMIAAHPRILSRRCQPGHITASALILHAASGRALLHYHKRLDRWLQVGGHADDEGDLAAVALREAREETGLPDLRFSRPGASARPIDCDAHVIPAAGEAPRHLHLDFRYLLWTRQPENLRPAPGESTRFRWLSVDEALALEGVDEGLKRLLRKARRQLSART